jgi:hypothetical protein
LPAGEKHYFSLPEPGYAFPIHVRLDDNELKGIVFPLAEGSLRDCMGRYPPLALADQVGVLLDVARALEALEGSGIVHGGINLEGVLWRRTNSGVEGMLHHHASLQIQPRTSAADLVSFSDMLNLLFAERVAFKSGPVNSLVVTTNFMCRKTTVKVSHLVQLLTDVYDELKLEESSAVQSSTEFDEMSPLGRLALRSLFCCLDFFFT